MRVCEGGGGGGEWGVESGRKKLTGQAPCCKCPKPSPQNVVGPVTVENLVT